MCYFMTDKILKEMKNYNPSKEDVIEILGRTGKTMEFKDYLTGKDIVYHLNQGDEIVDANCPIDDTPLLYFQVHAAAGYHCPNCSNGFTNVSKEGLESRYEEILNFKKELLKKSKNKEEKSNLIKIINAIEKK